MPQLVLKNWEQMKVITFTNLDDVLDYLKATGDSLLNCIGYPPIYKAKNNTTIKILDVITF